MSDAIPLTQQDLNTARALLEQEGPAEMYAFLASKGYAYAELAGDVVTGGSISGVTAVEFLKNTAELQSIPLQQTDIDSVFLDLGDSYLDKLQIILDASGTGSVTREITADEAWSIHNSTFSAHDLPNDAWTLNSIFELLIDSEDRQQYFDSALASNGSPLNEVWLALTTGGILAQAAAVGTGDDADKAGYWAFRTFRPESLGDEAGSLGIELDKFAANIGGYVFETTGLPSLAAISEAIAMYPADFFHGMGFALDLAVDGDINKVIRREFMKARRWDGGLDDAHDKYDTAKVATSPIILDLDDDGIETINIRSGAYFDYKGDGFRESTGWASADDGVLVVDKNNDGIINNGGELFGTDYQMTNGIIGSSGYAANGFAALGDNDSNSDGRIDSSDAIFSNLKVWVDENEDGESTASELHSLAEFNIKSISVAHISSTYIDDQNNEHREIGSYTRTDDSQGVATDVWFEINKVYTIPVQEVDVPSSILALPNLKGYGLVRDLHESMTLDESGQLIGLVADFSNAESKAEREAIANDLIYMWSGANAYRSTSRSSYIGDARKLYAVEAFLDDHFVQHSGTNGGTPNPGPNASGKILSAYSEIFDYFYSELTIQTYAKPVFEKINFLWDGELKKFVANLLPAADYLKEQIAIDNEFGRLLLSETVHALKVVYDLGVSNAIDFRESFSNESNAVQAIIDAEWLGTVATGLNDTITGDDSANIIKGLGGKDILSGLGGNDVIVGGKDNDLLQGGTGDDTYEFARGFGQDVILEQDSTSGNLDKIEFLDDIDPSEIIVSRDNINLYLSVLGSADRIKISNWFANPTAAKIESVAFNDTGNTVWDVTTLESYIVATPPSTGDDVIYGSSASDNISAGTGDDTVNANAGNDTIAGNEGDDYLEGDGGDDTYIYERGDGIDTIFDNDDTSGNQDTLEFTGNIGQENILISRDNVNLYLDIAGSSGADRIILKNWFTTTGGQVERVLFPDESILTASDLKAIINTPGTGNDYLFGSASTDSISADDGDDSIFGLGGDDILLGQGGDDVIEGGSGDDVISGGSGDDVLEGGAGNDTYQFSVDSEIDTVIETSGSLDTVQFGGDITPSEIRVLRDAWNNLTFAVIGTDSKLVITDYFTSNSYQIEKVEFSDETVWDSETIFQKSITASNSDDYVILSSGNDSFDGLDGSDEIYGQDGDDTLTGGLGDDVLNGGKGNDQYLFALGDGQDTIYDEDSTLGAIDEILFDEDILPTDILVYVRGRDLVLSIVNTTDSITIQDWYLSANNKIEQVIFDDEAVWDVQAIQSKAIITGTENDDDLYGTVASDILDGGAGNDRLYGYKTGVGTGNDTFIFSSGYGQDTIYDYDQTIDNLDTVKIRNLSPSDITIIREANSTGSVDLLITVNGTSDQLRVVNQFYSSSYGIENIVFDDTTTWTATEISQAPITPTTTSNTLGTGGADYFDLRNSANSVVYGYNNITGNSGDDTYLFSAGSGHDTIQDYGTGTNTDTIKLLGLTPADVLATRDISGSAPSNDLTISILGTSDKLTIKNYFLSSYKIESVLFADATEWTTVDLDAVPFDFRDGTSTTLSKTTTGVDSYLFGAGAGQDTLTDQDSTTSNIDSLILTGLDLDDVTIIRKADSTSSVDLLITVNGTSDQLRVVSQFYSASYGIERIVFDDDTVLELSDISLVPITPTTTSNTLATGGADYFDLRNSANSVVYGYNTSTGNSGNDTYIFGAGSGQDSVQDYGIGSNIDTVRLVGLTPSQVVLTREADANGSVNLLISVIGSSDVLKIKEQFYSSSYAIENIVFDDTTTWTATEISQAPITPTTTSNTLGTGGADYFDLRNSANSVVYGYNNITGNSGDDTYLFSAGSGHDTIQDYGTGTNTDTIKLLGLTPADVLATRDISGSAPSNDLTISILGTSDKLTIKNYFLSSYKIESVLFADATEWTTVDLDAVPFDFRDGTSTTLSKTTTGVDSYLFGAGAGQDTLTDQDSTTSNIDTIHIAGLDPAEITLLRDSNSSNSVDLVIKINTTTDTLTIKNQFYSSDYGIEKIIFDDETVWDAAYIANTPIPITTTTANGTSDSDIFDLIPSADTTAYGYTSSSSNSGNDTYLYSTGSGHDTIQDYGTGTNTDTIKLLGLTPADVLATRDISGSAPSNDLTISILGTSDKLTIKNYFLSSYKIESVLFADATEWTTVDLDAVPFDFRDGTSTTLSKTTTGVDSYLFGAGAGQDTLTDQDSTTSNIDSLILTGLDLDDVTIIRKADSTSSVDLLITVNGTSDQLRVVSQFYSASYGIERIVFDDDTVLELSDISLVPITPTTTSNTLATGGADYFDLRNSANSVVYGYNTSTGNSGNDTYIFGAGSGQDSVQDYGIGSNIDTVRLVGLTPSQVVLTREADANGSVNLLISVIGSSDVLKIKEQFYSSSYAIENIVFDDTTTWTATEISQAPITPTTTSNTLGTGGADYFDLRNSANSVVYGYNNITGNSGDDTYLFSAGSGHDTIQDYGTGTNTDTIKLLGLTPADVLATRDISGSAPSNDLTISILGTSDKLTIKNYFLSSYKIESVLFADATEWTTVDLDAVPFDFRDGTSTTLSKTTTGVDSYLFGAGAGQDTLTDQDSTTSNIDSLILTGLDLDDVTIIRKADSTSSVDLLITVNGTSDQLRVVSQFYSASYGIERIVFDDDTVLELSDISLVPITPTTTSNTLATGGADYFDLRNSANSVVYGYNTSTGNSGNDTYIFGAGSGQDSVQDYGIGSNIDTVRLVGLTPSQVVLTREADANGSVNLLISVIGSSDVLKIKEQFYSSSYAIENIVFDDTTTWTATEISQAPITPTTTSNTLGTGGADYFDLRNSANSVVYGYNNITGNSGDDTYLFSAGSGHDTIQDYGTGTNLDKIDIRGEIVPEQIWLMHVDNNLEISIIGTDDSLTVKNWYSNSSYQIEEVLVPGGYVLLGSVVADLIDAMDDFDPLPYGQTTLPEEYEEALLGIIGTSWAA